MLNFDIKSETEQRENWLNRIIGGQKGFVVCSHRPPPSQGLALSLCLSDNKYNVRLICFDFDEFQKLGIEETR